MLLPRGIHRLLELAQAPAQSHDWWGRVHALNVLRLVFIDSTLADDIGPYVTEVRMLHIHTSNIFFHTLNSFPSAGRGRGLR